VSVKMRSYDEGFTFQAAAAPKRGLGIDEKHRLMTILSAGPSITSRMPLMLANRCLLARSPAKPLPKSAREPRFRIRCP
jgi:hypothetical protein